MWWLVVTLQSVLIGLMACTCWMIKDLRTLYIRSVEEERRRELEREQREEKLKEVPIGKPAGIDVRPLQVLKKVDAAPEEWDEFHRECEEAFRIPYTAISR